MTSDIAQNVLDHILAATDGRESAIVKTLNPGANRTTGIAPAEAYKLENQGRGKSPNASPASLHVKDGRSRPSSPLVSLRQTFDTARQTKQPHRRCLSRKASAM